jgi:hypothetical protein
MTPLRRDHIREEIARQPLTPLVIAWLSTEPRRLCANPPAPTLFSDIQVLLTGLFTLV